MMFIKLTNNLKTIETLRSAYYLFQTKKTKFIHGRTFPVRSTMDETANDLLLVRVKTGRKYTIRVLDRLSGDLCKHRTILNRHHRHADYASESCPICSYDINTTGTFNVDNDCEIISVLMVQPELSLWWTRVEDYSNLVGMEDHSEKHNGFKTAKQQIFDKRFLRFCNVEYDGILMHTMKVDHDYEIVALMMESGTVMWRWSK